MKKRTKKEIVKLKKIFNYNNLNKLPIRERTAVATNPLSTKNWQGVYYIFCRQTNKYYIGLSTNLLNRFQNHFLSLIKQKHSNCDLQQDFDKYSISDFDFRVLEYTNNLYCKETFWIHYFILSNKKLYNKIIVAS